MTTIRRLASGMLVCTALTLVTGCPAEDGLKEGLNDGVSAAVVALIETPVTIWLEERYSQDNE